MAGHDGKLMYVSTMWCVHSLDNFEILKPAVVLLVMWMVQFKIGFRAYKGRLPVSWRTEDGGRDQYFLPFYLKLGKIERFLKASMQILHLAVPIWGFIWGGMGSKFPSGSVDLEKKNKKLVGCNQHGAPFMIPWLSFGKDQWSSMFIFFLKYM